MGLGGRGGEGGRGGRVWWEGRGGKRGVGREGWQGRRNALISGQVNFQKNGGSGVPPPENFFRFGALRGGSGDFWTEQAR